MKTALKFIGLIVLVVVIYLIVVHYWPKKDAVPAGEVIPSDDSDYGNGGGGAGPGTTPILSDPAAITPPVKSERPTLRRPTAKPARLNTLVTLGRAPLTKLFSGTAAGKPGGRPGRAPRPPMRRPGT